MDTDGVRRPPPLLGGSKEVGAHPISVLEISKKENEVYESSILLDVRLKDSILDDCVVLPPTASVSASRLGLRHVSNLIAIHTSECLAAFRSNFLRPFTVWNRLHLHY